MRHSILIPCRKGPCAIAFTPDDSIFGAQTERRRQSESVSVARDTRKKGRRTFRKTVNGDATIFLGVSCPAVAEAASHTTITHYAGSRVNGNGNGNGNERDRFLECRDKNDDPRSISAGPAASSGNSSRSSIKSSGDTITARISRAFRCWFTFSVIPRRCFSSAYRFAREPITDPHSLFTAFLAVLQQRTR